MGPVRFSARLAALLIALTSMTTSVCAATSLDTIRKAGLVRCGIDRSEPEFSLSDEHGARLAFDQDFCRAVAVAVLGQAAKIVVKTYPDDETSIAALKAGSIDLIASISLDFSHSTDFDLSFTRPLLYDGEAIMVPLKLHLNGPPDLRGKTICLLDETEGAARLRSWFKEHSWDFFPFPFQEQGEMEAAFVTGNCAALAGDITRLGNTRVSLGTRATEYAILPDIYATDPLAASFPSADRAWGRVICWTLEILLQAEENGITSENAATFKASNNPAVRRLLGTAHELGAPLGLDAEWAATVIRVVGNYGELYERTLGSKSALKLPRGRNGLRRNGGMLEALPLK